MRPFQFGQPGQLVSNLSGFRFLATLAIPVLICFAFQLTPGSASADIVFLGQGVTEYASLTNPFELAFDSSGVLYAGQNHPTNSSANIWRIPAGGGSASSWGGATDDPDGVDVFGDFVYVGGESEAIKIRRDNGNTSVLADLTGRNVTSVAVIQNSASSYGTAGDMIVGNARYSTDIQIVQANGTVVDLANSIDLNVPRGLVFAQGELFLVESDATEGVWKVSSSGTVTQLDDQGFAWTLPNAMAYSASDDSFYVGDSGQIIRIARTGGATEIVGTGFSNIDGLVFDSQGHLYISDGFNDKIWRSVASVPEPCSLALFAMGGTIGFIRVRKRQRTQTA